MSTNFRQLMSRLHVAAKTYQLEKVSAGVYRLLQLSRMTEKELGEAISSDDTLEANLFWMQILHTTQISNEVVHKNARSFYAVLWSAANNSPSRALRTQAGEYCDDVAEACEKYLIVHTAEIKSFASPAQKTAAHLRLVETK